MEKSGHISINTENILPIIKKWLYDDKDIFIRELVSNGTDAITKIQKVILTEKTNRDIGTPKIQIGLDKKAKTLTIEDNGIGMTADEIEKYINQVAFSGMQDFVDQYKNESEQNQIIGHFGLGFYSAFMVAEKVEIESLSYRDDAKAVKWSCDGSTEFKLSESKKSTVGTKIILHLNEESKEYLEDDTVKATLEKYCLFMKYPVFFKDDQINTPTPLWSKNPSQISDQEYQDFYSQLFPLENKPLFWIHINFDYPFNLRGIVFFPDLTKATNLQEGNIKLFCNQVFVSEHCKEVVPEFLGFLQGAIECPEIPLNVSRSALNKDPLVRKIREHLSKKILDKIVGMEKTARDNYEKDWEKLGSFVKFAMLNDSIYYDKLKSHVLFETTTGDFYNIKELKEKLGDKKSVLYCVDQSSQASYIQTYENAGVPVLLMNQVIDAHFIGRIETEKELDVQFRSVDSGELDDLIDKEAKPEIIVDANDKQDKAEKITTLFKKHLAEGMEVKVESLKTKDIPALIIEDETLKRYKEMSKLNKDFDLSKISEMLGAKTTLLVNKSSPAITKVLDLMNGISPDPDTQELLVKYVVDLAKIQQGTMDQKSMLNFVERSSKIMERVN